MSTEEFDENCNGCRPAVIDKATGKALASESPEMVKVNAIYDRQATAVKRAFHRVCCLNSRDPGDLLLVKCFTEQIGAALSEN